MQELHSVFRPKTALVLFRTLGTILGTLVPGVCEIDPMLLRFVWPCLKTPDRILATWKPRWCQSRVAAADKRRPIREQPRPLLLCTLERPHFRTRILGSQKFLRSSASWTSQRPDWEKPVQPRPFRTMKIFYPVKTRNVSGQNGPNNWPSVKKHTIRVHLKARPPTENQGRIHKGTTCTHLWVSKKSG